MIYRLIGIYCVHTSNLHYITRTLDRCPEIIFSDYCRLHNDIKYNQASFTAREILVSFDKDEFRLCCEYLSYLFANEKSKFPMFKGSIVENHIKKPNLKYLDRAIERVMTPRLTHRAYNDLGHCTIMSVKQDNTLNTDIVYSAASIGDDSSIYIGSTTSSSHFRMHNHYEHKDSTTFNKFVKDHYDRGEFNKLRFTSVFETTDGELASHIEDAFTTFINGSFKYKLLNDSIKYNLNPRLVMVCEYYWSGIRRALFDV